MKRQRQGEFGFNLSELKKGRVAEEEIQHEAVPLQRPAGLAALFAERAQQQTQQLQRQRREEAEELRLQQEEERREEEEARILREEIRQTKNIESAQKLLLTPAGARVQKIFEEFQCGTENCPMLSPEQLMTIPIDRIVVIGGCCYDAVDLYDRYGSNERNWPPNWSHKDKQNYRSFLEFDGDKQMRGLTEVCIGSTSHNETIETDETIDTNGFMLRQGLFDDVVNEKLRDGKRVIGKFTLKNEGRHVYLYYLGPSAQNTTKISKDSMIKLNGSPSAFLTNLDLSICDLPELKGIHVRILDKLFIPERLVGEIQDKDAFIKQAVMKRLQDYIESHYILETGEIIDTKIFDSDVRIIVDRLQTALDVNVPVAALTPSIEISEIKLTSDYEYSDATPRNWLETEEGQNFINYLKTTEAQGEESIDIDAYMEDLDEWPESEEESDEVSGSEVDFDEWSEE